MNHESRPIPQIVKSVDTLPCLRPSRPFDTSTRVDFDVAGRTDRGRVRTRNEDQFLIADMERRLTVRETSLGPPVVTGPQGTLLAVADGMGGHTRGDLASAIAIDTLVHYVVSRMPWAHHDGADAQYLLDDLARALSVCERRLRHVANRKHIDQGVPGTTLTAAYIAWPSMFVAHAGDSRCYLLRDGQLFQLTRDHTLAAQLAECLPDDDNVVPPSWSHVLSNAVSTGEEHVKAEVHQLTLHHDDAVLLCSDGLTRYLDDESIAHHIATASNATDACESLVAVANEAGGADNITVVVARSFRSR